MTTGNPVYGQNTANFEPMLKIKYPKMEVEAMGYKDHPFHAMIQKKNDLGGEKTKVPLIYAYGQANGSNFRKAQLQGQTANLKSVAFYLTVVADYAFAQVMDLVMEQSKNEDEAFDQATIEIDKAILQITRNAATHEYGDGSGLLATVGVVGTGSNGLTTSQIQVLNVDDIVKFEDDQNLTYVPTGTSSARGTLGQFDKIAKIDRNTGIITFTAAVSISGVVAGDGLVRDNDVNDDMTIGNKIHGLAAWLPYGGPASNDSFMGGVNRSVDPTRLAGIWLDISMKALDEGLIDLMNLVARENGRPDKCFINFRQFGALEKLLGSRKVYTEVKAEDGSWGFKGLELVGPRGTVDVIPDGNCPVTYAYMLTMSTWTLHTLREFPHIVETDGLKLQRLPSADGTECRIRAWGEIGNTAPGYNAVGKLGLPY